ncbi:right-handed parallel beta-helix repeat-containing protein [Ascidiimonas sp. W6]|uniref:right-handed parallel beta-helix repeat-containing protein n=1 Tax=Ascidiimonas meishanensis TaxID=3128903 RepID=UPI0030ECA3A3
MKCSLQVVLFLFCQLVWSQSKYASEFGYNENDATLAFTKALNSAYDTIIIDKQNKDWILSPTVISNIHHKVIMLESGVVLRAKKNAFKRKGDVLLKFLNCSHLQLFGYGASLVMNKEEYTDGEWRMTLSLINVNTISIKGLKFANSGGDGIYIDGWKKGDFSQNIIIEDIVSENHKRQGMSIISAQDVWVKNAIFKDTKGTLPEAGLDLEPDDPEDRMVNINFENCKFINNNHSGIVLGLNKLNSSSIPVSITFKNCYLSMNHIPENAYVAAEIVSAAAPKDPVKGRVIFDGLLVDGSDWGILYSRKISKAYKVIFKNSTAKNICKKQTMPPVYLEVPDYFASSGPLGGFEFDNLKVDYEGDLPFMKVRGSSLRTLKGVESIEGTVFTKFSYQQNIEYVKYNPNQNRNVSISFFLSKDN